MESLCNFWLTFCTYTCFTCMHFALDYFAKWFNCGDNIPKPIQNLLFYEIFILKPHLKLYHPVASNILCVAMFLFLKRMFYRNLCDLRNLNMQNRSEFSECDSIVSKFIRTCLGLKCTVIVMCI